MAGKKILFLCDESDIDIVEKSLAKNGSYDPTIETTERILEHGVNPYLERTIELMIKYPQMYDAVVGTHDSSALFAAIIAEKTGKRFASVQSIINCQNKYISRRIQRDIVSEHTPAFCLALDYLRNPSRLETPFFIKPVRSNISFGTHKISSPEELHSCIATESLEIARHNQYFLDAFFVDPKYMDPFNVQTCNAFLCEDLIQGSQVTVDGFVCDGSIDLLGMTRAFHYPGSNSFSHHEFPWRFNPQLEQAIHQTLKKLIPALGLNNTFFNVELRADEDRNTFAVIEVNSRIAFQFAKTIESVTGFDPLHLLCDIALGRKPQYKKTVEKTYKYCCNFELHSFSDRKILKTPTQSGLQELYIRFPEVHFRNLIQENTQLSDYKHNPESFRYCMLDIPGNSRAEIMEKYNTIMSLLGYEFAEEDKAEPI